MNYRIAKDDMANFKMSKLPPTPAQKRAWLSDAVPTDTVKICSLCNRERKGISIHLGRVFLKKKKKKNGEDSDLHPYAEAKELG